LSANQFFYGLRQGDEHRVKLERGVELLIGLEAISDPDERGMRTVMCIINGQLRPVLVRDRSIASTVPAVEKADRGNPITLPRRSPGWSRWVCPRRQGKRGPDLATIEAMRWKPDHRSEGRDRGAGGGVEHRSGGGRGSAVC